MLQINFACKKTMRGEKEEEEEVDERGVRNEKFSSLLSHYGAVITCQTQLLQLLYTRA